MMNGTKTGLSVYHVPPRIRSFLQAIARQDRPGQLRASFGEDCQERKAMTRLRPQSSMKAFKAYLDLIDSQNR